MNDLKNFFQLGISGVLVNGASTYLILKMKVFVYLVVLVLDITIAKISFRDFSGAFGVNRSIGQMTLIAQCGAYLSMLLLSLNRFVCVFMPIKYTTIFANRSTILFIILSFLNYISAPCYFIFDHTSLQFTFSDTECGHVLSDYVDYWFSIVLFTIACVLDLATLIKLQLVSSIFVVNFRLSWTLTTVKYINFITCHTLTCELFGKDPAVSF
ncbi:unnamed protein product [Haemonchus placei]|uniref:7TM GPCR serpentine receptor class x (Srx) domain-containing protein n=1 Tax=Haemonchus placei TaxID=6290 RepID=A0A3P7ZN43_HAEPC|nr:unnamed protein product [Haemonchus placei]